MSNERKGSQFWLGMKILVAEFSQLRTPHLGQRSIITGEGRGSSFLGEIAGLRVTQQREKDNAVIINFPQESRR